MRLWRNKTFVRVLVLVQLLLMAESSFLANYSWALTTGPFQPEYISYEEPGATDMVNLLTGDFSFSLPVMEVPGPEGSFSLPLSYHAGIGPDQEASWVGLGWTMNPGAITRAVNGYPDDANGESHSITKKDLTGVRGWTSSILGFGEVGWNTMQGHYGMVNLLLVSLEYDNKGVSSVGVAGLSVSRNGLKFDAAAFGLTLLSIGLTAGLGEVVTGLGLLKQETYDFITNTASMGISALSGSNPMNAPDLGAWQYSRKVKQEFLHKDYWIWLDQARTEKMYGALYLGNAPTASYTNTDPSVNLNLTTNGVSTPLSSFPRSTSTGSVGSASDMSQAVSSSANYYQTDNPSLLSTDNYSVKAPGISGSITPYRLDIGSVSMPREMSTNHDRLVSVGYLNNYKVPFIYDGTPTNAYFQHVGGASGVNSPTFYFGASSTNSYVPSVSTLNLNLNDVVLQNQRIGPNITNNRIAKESHVEWISNEDILNEATRSSLGFQDFLTGTPRTTFRTNVNIPGIYQSMAFYSSMPSFSATIPINAQDISKFAVGQIVDLNLTIHQTGQSDQLSTVSGATISSVGSASITVSSGSISPYLGMNVDIQLILHIPQDISKAIGGYSITNSGGVTYHFAIPAYDYEQITTMKDLSDPSNKYTVLNRLGAFANTWLLTAITGPDYVDRGPGGTANGIVDDADWGYWVKLNYGLYSSNFQWRIPFSGDRNDPANTSATNTIGRKQMYYLNSVETRSHVALFVKDLRLDSKSVNGVQSLKLTDMCLVKKEVYQTWMSTYSVPNYSTGTDNICIIPTLPAGSLNNLYQNSIKRVSFGYVSSPFLGQH